MHLYVMKNHSGDYWWDLPFLEYDEKKYIAFDIKDMIVSWKKNKNMKKYVLYVLIIVLKTGPARRVDPGLELDQIEEKIEEKNNPVWAGCNPLTFNFFKKSKWHRFDFFKKKIDLGDPVKTRNPGRVWKLWF